MRVDPGIDAVEITALYRRIPRSKRTRGSLFGGSGQVIFGMVFDSVPVNVGVVVVPPIEQRNIPMTKYRLTNHIETVIFANLSLLLIS